MAKIYYKGNTYGGYVAGERNPFDGEAVDITDVSATTTEGNMYVNRSDELFTISFSGVKLSSALAASSSVTIFNVSTALAVEPVTPAKAVLSAGGTLILAELSAAGVLSFTNTSGSAVATTTPIDGQISFVGV